MANTRQGTVLFSALLLLISTSVVMQLWLLTSAVSALMAHQFSVLKPILAGSALLLIFNAVLVSVVFSFDRRIANHD